MTRQEKEDRIIELILKKLRNDLSPQEQEELDSWKEESMTNKAFAEQFTQANITEQLAIMGSTNTEKEWDRFQEMAPFPAIDGPKRFTWYRLAAAASILIVGLSLLFFWRQYQQDTVQTAAPEILQHQFTNDLDPGNRKASLILADGKIIALDSAQSGMLGQQSGSTIHQQDGQVWYEPAATHYEKPVYNTVTTPRGGEYRLVLPDGSKVWLNAASSIRFPAAFAGATREVDITGEVYFEVAKNARMPFLVSAGGMQVKVLGTHFNVNAYADEPFISTTLLEGLVEVTKNKDRKVIQPGQQAIIGQQQPIAIQKNVDLVAVMAWQQNQFNFKAASIEEVMRQVSRWYDVDISYGGRVEQRFSGTIPRNMKASALLNMLEQIGYVKFNIDGKKITVTPHVESQ